MMDSYSIETDKYDSINVNSDKRDSSAATPTINFWHKLIVKWLPVEILIILILFGVMCSMQIYQQYFFKRYASELLMNYSSYTPPNESICFTQDYIVNLTNDNSSIELIQKEANDMSMYYEVINLSASSVMALFYGPLSDRIGRKPVLLLVLIGLCICTTLQVIIIEFDLSLEYFLFSSAIYGLFGGLPVLLGVSFAAVTDITPKSWITIRMGAVESTIGFAKIASYLAIFYWINSNGCYFKSPVYLMPGVSLVAFIYIFMWPEPLQQNPKSSKGRSHGFEKLINGAKIFFFPPYIGFSKWWRVWIAAIVICLECLCALGIVQIMNYFLHNRPLQWSYDLIGIYGVVSSAGNIFSLIIVLPVLVAIRLPDPIIGIIGCIFGIVSNIMIATIKTSWEMFLAGILQGMQQVGFPAMRSVLAGLVDPEDYGSVLTITASLQMVASIGSTVLFNEVYHPQAVVNGHTINSGVVFYITAGIWALAIPLVLLLLIKRKGFIPIQLVDENTLLSSDKSTSYHADYSIPGN